MPNQPYGSDRDATEIFLESGASVLMELGSLLCDLESAQCRGLRCGDADDLRERVGRKQREVDAFFAQRPKAAMREYVSAGSGGDLDPRACRLVAYLAARMVLDEMDAVPLMRVARGISLTGSPAEILESRRFAADAGVVGDDGKSLLVRALGTIMDRQSVMAKWVAGQMAMLRETLATRSEPEGYMTTRRAARYMHRSRSWLLRQKDIPYYRGKPNLYKRDDLDEWMDRNMRHEPML